MKRFLHWLARMKSKQKLTVECIECGQPFSSDKKLEGRRCPKCSHVAAPPVIPARWPDWGDGGTHRARTWTRDPSFDEKGPGGA